MADSERSPYGRFSIADVQAAENGHFVIQIGDDLFEENNFYAFKKEKAENLYDIAREGLEGISKAGTELEQLDAIKRLQNMRLIPLRIH